MISGASALRGAARSFTACSTRNPAVLARPASAFARRAARAAAQPTRHFRPSPSRRAAATVDADTLALQDKLALALGAKVTIRHTGGESGDIRIAFRNFDQLDDSAAAFATRRIRAKPGRSAGPEAKLSGREITVGLPGYRM